MSKRKSADANDLGVDDPKQVRLRAYPVSMFEVKKRCFNVAWYPEPTPEQSTKGGQTFIRGGQSLKLSKKAAVFKRVSLLIGGGGQASRLGGQAPLTPPWRRPWWYQR